MRLINKLALGGLGLVSLFSSLSVPDNFAQDRCKTPSVTQPYEVRTAYPNQEMIGGILKDLEKVPDPLQRRASEGGYQVSIVSDTRNINTRLFNLPEVPPGANSAETKDGKIIVTFSPDVDVPETSGRASVHVSVSSDPNAPTIYTFPKKVKYTGYFDSATRRAIIPQTINGDNTTLHEYGHLQAQATGSVDETGEFLSVYRASEERREAQVERYNELNLKYSYWETGIKTAQEGRYRTINDVPVQEWIKRYALTPEELEEFEGVKSLRETYTRPFYEMRTPTEFWAGVFSAYYDTPKSRVALRTNYPEAYNFLHQWEQMYAPGCQ